MYQHPSGSKFKEEEVSAVLTSETSSYAPSSVDELPGSWRNLRTISSRLQKSRRAPLPSFHVSDVQVSEIMNVPHPSVSFACFFRCEAVIEILLTSQPHRAR
jgi:hypothetical protein